MRLDAGSLRGRIDWVLVGALAAMLAIGCVAILSAAEGLPYYTAIRHKHFIALGFGLLLFMIALGFNYQIFQDQSKIIYALSLVMMASVLLVGEVQRGQRAWIRLPFFSFQPSELARVTTILVLANYLDRNGRKANTVGFVVGAFAWAAPVIALILLEPDFSSTLSFFPMVLGMLFCAGANAAALGALAGFGGVTVSLPLAWTLLGAHPDWIAHSAALRLFMSLREFGPVLLGAVLAVFLLAYLSWKLASALRFNAPAAYYGVAALIVSVGLASGAAFDHQLKGYQRDRFMAFVLPKADPKGASYNVRQAQIAIGSGGLWGKGIFSGTQSQLGFLPERHTDFIYAVVGEEMGFLGAMAVLGLYLTLLWRVIHAARLARDRYGSLLCCGVASVYAFYLFVNVGMCLGLMPVAGVPLPLLSYGGSNLAMTLFALGIVGNVYSRRYAFY